MIAGSRLAARGSPLRIHVWTQNYAPAAGGIVAFSRFLVRALRDLYPEAEICVFSKNDRQYSFPENEPATKVVCFGHWPGGLRAVAFGAGLIRHAMSERPDLIISTHVNFAPVARLLQRFVRVPFCAIGHGIEVWEIHKASVRQGLRAADQLVAVSEFTRTRMAAALGLSADRIEILPNTFDSEKFQPAPKPASLLARYGLTPDQPVILTVARLEATEQYKGYDQVLRALPAVLRQFPNARYVIVGDGPDRTRLGALSRELATASSSGGELGVEDKVILAGYVPNDELCGYYNLSDVFVMPSKGEGFGIVFLEALSCGKPVIAGNKDGSIDAVLNGKLGALVDPDDGAEIGAAITRVLAASRDQRSEVSGQGADVGGQMSEVPPSVAAATEGVAGIGQTSDFSFPLSAFPLSKTPERLRREVIEAYGFERFRTRLGEILSPLLVHR